MFIKPLISISALLLYLQIIIGPSCNAFDQPFQVRFKRQLQQSNPPNSLSDNGQATSPGRGPQDSSNPQDSDQDKPPEEVLTSLKCDFGTSDAADLCKFKLIEPNLPAKSLLPTWTLGSGKLALYQGGPLMDASGGNDTTGGYIFYETSNPYVNHTRQEHIPGSNSIMHLIHQQDTHQFQQITSPRVAISPSPISPVNGPSFMSPNLTASGPSGMCLSFHFAINGLSADELHVSVFDQKNGRTRQLWSSSESAAGNWTKGEILYSAQNQHSVVFSGLASSSSMSTGSAKDVQQRKFRGYVALDEIEINKHDTSGSEGACRGHCNFDGDLCGWTNAENVEEDDFDWSFGRGSDNLFTGPSRDFTSSNNNELTGSFIFTDSKYPRRPGDKAQLVSPIFQPTAMNDAMCMRFAVHMFGSGIGTLSIKIRYTEDVPVGPAIPGGPPTQAGPNQPGAGASPQPQASRSSDGKQNNDLVIWEMSGDAGNTWHQAQTSVSSSKSPFQVVIEGVIGENHLGNIAVDEISFSSGPCPTSPPVASKNYGDCTFEQSMCFWRNPDVDIHLDDLDWVRSADEQSIHGPNVDHTLKRRSGSYLKLENTFREPKSGTRAFLLSPIFQPKASGSVQCLSFYYYMFMRSIGSSGPNLGTIRVYLASNNELVPIWRLTNPISSPSWKHARASLSTAMVDGQPVAPSKLFQIAFEGIWGDAPAGAIAIDDITIFDGACELYPAEAKSVPGECTFDVDMCSWSNKTFAGPSQEADDSRSPFLDSVNPSGYLQSAARLNASPSRRSNWQLATVDSRPVNLQDHTYKAPIGYIYVDVLDQTVGQQSMLFSLQSAENTVQPGQQVAHCLSFWFAAYGRSQEANQLNVYLTQASAPPPPPDESAPPGPPAPNRPNSNQPAGGAQGSSGSSPNDALTSAGEAENANAWKSIDGKLLWSMSLKNVTELSRRKWQYSQVSIKADSNYIIRFAASSSDGGFALDDISYYDGLCETRPSLAKVSTSDDEDVSGGGGPSNQPGQPGGGSSTSGGGPQSSGGSGSGLSGGGGGGGGAGGANAGKAQAGLQR